MGIDLRFPLLRYIRRDHATDWGPTVLTAAHLQLPVVPLAPFDPLVKAIHQFRIQNVPALPVVDQGFLTGWVTLRRVAALLDSEEPVEELVVEEAAEVIPAVLTPFATMDVMDELMRTTGTSLLPVATGNGQYLGCVMHADVLAVRARRLAPPSVGGMATPLGVYLTTGRVSGGASMAGLLLTGAVMAFMLWLVQTALYLGSLAVYSQTHNILAFYLSRAVMQKSMSAPHPLDVIFTIIALLLVTGGFLLVLRFFPRMAGFHAAEHQTVHAIETGELLTPDAVARQPRVHPRCGTNLSGLMALLYLGVTLLSIILAQTSWSNISLVVAGVVWYIVFVLLYWKRLGGWIQQHLTTRKATPDELASGIRAGNEVLAKHLANPTSPLRPWQRIWNMGLVQILLGAILMGYLLQLCQGSLDVLARSLVK